jgi:hypothetical protein
VPYQGSIRSRVSQFDTIAPNLPHQWSTLLVRGREIRLRIKKRPCLVEKFHPQISQPVEFLPSVGQGFQEDRHIVVGFRMRIAPRAREPNSTTRSISSPYSASSAALKRRKTGSSVGRTVMLVSVHSRTVAGTAIRSDASPATPPTPPPSADRPRTPGIPAPSRLHPARAAGTTGGP